MASKQKIYFQTFKDSYSKDFPCIKRSRLGEKYAFCEYCRSDFNIAHSGKYDVSRHIKSAKHLEFAKASTSSSKLVDFFKNDAQNDVIRAELLFTSFLIEHNIPLAAADHAGPLFRKMFPKCETAKHYGCARTKTSALANAMASSAFESMLTTVNQFGPFSAACDGSNDSEFKLYPIVIAYFNPTNDQIENNLLSIPNLVGDATGENISNLILNEFERLNIPIDNCLSFMTDNASVMVGKNKGVIAFLKQRNSNIVSLGCACHLINLAAEKGAASLPVNVDEILVDIYYYLNKSSKRIDSLKQFQLLHDNETKKILKHVCTRWLSLGKCLSRLIELWDPLMSFFKKAVKSQQGKICSELSTFKIPKKTSVAVNSESSSKNVENVKSSHPVQKVQHNLFSTSKVKSSKRKINGDDAASQPSKKSRKASLKKKSKMPIKNKNVSKILTREETIFMFLSSTEMKSYCFFLLNVIPVFDTINKMLQTVSPLIHKLKNIYCELLKGIFCRFLKPSVIRDTDLLDINFYLEENHKALHDITIGNSTSAELAKLSDEKKNVVLINIKKYYIAVCNYILNKFPIKDIILEHAQVADLTRIGDFTFSHLKYFVDKFPCLIKEKPGQSRDNFIDEIESQFSYLQSDDVLSHLDNSKRMDSQWAEVGRIVGLSGLPKYRELSNLMLSILLISHSNAECERVFSMMKKNRNQFRSGLSNKTLESLLILKTHKRNPCYENVFTDIELNKAKKATAASLKGVENTEMYEK